MLLALLVLLILLAIMAQLVFGTRSDADVARNDIALTTMDLAIESSLLEVFDRLRTDAEGAGDSAAAGAAAGAAGADPAAAGESGAAPAPAGAGEQQGPVDSREDPWGRPQRTTINEIQLRIVVQDEDSKLNVLGMLAPNQEEADKCLERVQRVIDNFREGTDADIDSSTARQMAEAMRDYMKDRTRQVLPKPRMLADEEEKQDQGLLLSLEELAVIEPFDESLFRDYREPDGRVVHSLSSFLTTWTSVSSGSTAAPSGAPAAAGPATGNGGAADGGAGGAAAGDGAAGGDSGAAPGDGGAAGAEGGGDSTGGNQAGGNQGGGNQGGAGGAAAGAASKYGVAVNVNTAPGAVLKALIDDRDVPSRFWDEVIEYRNLEEEPEEGDTGSVSADLEPVYDEFGEEVIERRVFDSLDELRDVDGYQNLDGAARAQLDQLLTTESQVFSIMITARKPTGEEDRSESEFRDPDEREDLIATTLTRTVRCVVWRRTSGDNVLVVPILRWEVLDYVPLVVEDYPDERR